MILAGNVAKRDPRTGEVRVFLAGTEMPDDPADWFTQPAGSSQPDPEPHQGTEVEPEQQVPPPRAGAGSGRAAWVSFAAGKVDVTDDMRRDDIVAALQAAGHLDD